MRKNIGDRITFTSTRYKYSKLTYGKTYIIINIHDIQSVNKRLYKILNDYDEEEWFGDKYFDDVQELRKIKLNRLQNEDDSEFNDTDYFEDENRTIKSYLIETYEIKIKHAIENENYEDAEKYKNILSRLSIL